MAETEVSMSMEDVVVKTIEEEEQVLTGHQNKAQVILQLQSISTGNGDETGETGSAVVAVEAQEEALAMGDDVDLGYSITCGESKAILLFKKFVCPGINVKCVKFEDQLISPKQFVHMSGKATLKDWKRAIRIGGVMLRKMMDLGQLDFYQHSTLCTNTCRSTKFDLLINNTRFPLDRTVLSTSSSAQGQVAVGNEGEVVMAEEKPEEAAGSLDWTSVATGESTEKKEVTEISEEALSFWKGIADVGLMGEVVTNISTELMEMLRGVQLRSDQTSLQDAEVAVLSNLAQVFGLLDSIKRILSVRRQMTEPAQKQVLKTLISLEQQLEEQKKQQSWLTQSQALGGLLQASPSPAKRAPKRPRLQRPASTTLLGSTVSQSLALQPQQFTVLSPITLSSIGQPFTVASLAQTPGAVTLHALPAGLQQQQFFARVGADGKAEAVTLHPTQSLALLGAAPGTSQEPFAPLGTVVSAVELVRLAQGATSGTDLAHCGEEEVVGQEEVVTGAVLVQEGVVGVEQESESLAHAGATTVIEIDPAPGEHEVGVVELQTEGGEEEGNVNVKEEEGEELSEVSIQGETEEVKGDLEEVQTETEELQLQANGQIHNLQILVLEEGGHT